MSQFWSLILLFTLFSYGLAIDVKSPEDPRPPVLADPTNKENVEKSESKDPPAKGKKRIRLNLKLCDGREVSGSFEYEKNELNIKHIKDGIPYEKKLKISEIKKMYIHSWEGKKEKKAKEGYTYRFEPSEMSVLSRDGDTFKLKGSQFQEFQKIVLNNSFGTTTLYTFWIDLKHDTGSWYTGLPPFKGTEREDCHPDSVRTIFLYPEE